MNKPNPMNIGGLCQLQFQFATANKIKNKKTKERKTIEK